MLAFVTDRRREDLTLDLKVVAGNFDGRDERKLLAKAISGWKAANVPRASVPSRCRFEDTGDPRPIERGSRFDYDWDVTH